LHQFCVDELADLQLKPIAEYLCDALLEQRDGNSQLLCHSCRELELRDRWLLLNQERKMQLFSHQCANAVLLNLFVTLQRMQSSVVHCEILAKLLHQ
jgi:hypothetical protein